MDHQFWGSAWLTTHSTGRAQKAAQSGEFKRKHSEITMAGRPPKVFPVKLAFLNQLTSAHNLVAAISDIPLSVRDIGVPYLHPKNAEQVVELAFMAVVAAWEEFLERTLVRYLAGAQAQGGYSPTPKYGRANSIQHAYELLSQDPSYDPAKHYLKVTDSKWVRSSADFYFSNHPYQCLQTKADLLRHASFIRNRVAHASEKCRVDFKTSAIYFMHYANNTLPQGLTPGKLLVTPVRRHFGQPAIQNGLSHFHAYLDLYESLANSIVP